MKSITETEKQLLYPSKIFNWQCSSSSQSELCFATNVYDLRNIIEMANNTGKSLSFRGGGCSYSDCFLNDRNIVVDLSRMSRIKSWDPDEGKMVVEPGVTFEKALLKSLPDNWILPAVPGSRYPTIGGAISNNVHGKNSFKHGNFGDCVTNLVILLASRDVIECNRVKDSELFHAVIGGIGLFGIVLEASLQLMTIPSPYFVVSKSTVPNIYAMIEKLELLKNGSDYIIGQVDTFAKNRQIGRGTIHTATFSDETPPKGVAVLDHVISKRMFKVLPKRWITKIGRGLLNDHLMKWISTGKYYLDSTPRRKKISKQPFFHFNFLLDQVPDWKHIFPQGFVEHESLLPTDKAPRVFDQLIQLSHKYEIPAYLAAVKAHKGDDYLLSFAMDGYSIGIDFPVTPGKTKDIEKLLFEMNELILRNGGTVYLAKDQALSKGQARTMYKNLEQFMAIKRRYDPLEIFQSNMYRRLIKGN